MVSDDEGEFCSSLNRFILLFFFWLLSKVFSNCCVDEIVEVEDGREEKEGVDLDGRDDGDDDEEDEEGKKLNFLRFLGFGVRSVNTFGFCVNFFRGWPG